MSGVPLTRNPVSPALEAKIRAAVQAAEGIAFEMAPSRVARLSDAAALYEFLSDPEIHSPIYNLPKPLTLESTETFISQNLEAQARGEGFLLLRFDDERQILGYSDFEVWPHWGAGELGGAIRADRQGQRVGFEGAKRTFAWMFETLHLDLICETAALDNIRTAKMLDHLGFERKGEIESTRPDGSVRASRVWELTRTQWSKT